MDIPREFRTSPYYPLPEDYNDLTGEGQRLARINACRLWTLRLQGDTPEDLARRLIAATDFLDRYYLQPDEDAEFDPAFYDLPPLPTPRIHWELSRLWATNRLSVAIAPRGSAKSSHGRKDIILRLLSEPKYSFVYATSSIENARDTGDRIRHQVYENPRIQDDWSKWYKVDSMKTLHGRGMKGASHFKLANNSSFRVVSASSKLRGMRPRRFRLDDPEHDARVSTDMGSLRKYIEDLLFRVVLPAVTRPDVAADWTATYVSPKHYAPHAMSVMDTPEGPRATDPRFEMWGRLFIPGAFEDENGRLVSCWPEMWPIDEAEKQAKGYAGAVTHEQLRVILGPSAYNIEVLGKLTHGEDAYFRLDPSPKGKHAFWFTDVDDELRDNPRASRTKINFLRPDGEESTHIAHTLRDFLAGCKLFMSVDSAYTETFHSDRRVATLMALTDHNELFILDMWSDQKGDKILVDKAFAICDRWKCPVIYVEVIKETIATYKRFQALAHTKASETMGYAFIPAIKDLRPGMMPKASKISTLDFRFEHSLIKIPLFMRVSSPPIARLVDQIEGFSPEAHDGGLAKDDEIDSVSMSTLIIKGKHRHAIIDSPLETAPTKRITVDVAKELSEGRRHALGGKVDLLAGFDPRLVDDQTLATIMEATANRLRGTPGGSGRKSFV